MARIPRRWWLVAALSVTTTVGYGVLTYAYAVFLIPLQQALDTGRAVVAGGQAAALIAGGLTAVPVGRWLDRRSPRLLMVTASVLGSVLLLCWSRVQSVPQLYLVSIGLGVVSAGVLYEAAFASVVRWFGPRQRGTAILVITIVGGFASTIFFPLCGFLIEAYGWRDALVVLAALFGLFTVPLHLTIRRPRPYERPDRSQPDAASAASLGEPASHRPAGSREPAESQGPPEPSDSPEVSSGSGRADRRAYVRTALTDRVFWLLIGGFVAEGAANAVIALHVVAYLTELGHPPTTAASVAGLLGVLSVAGRLVTTVLQRRRSTSGVVAVIFVVQAVGVLLLPVFGFDLIGAIACVVAFGIGQGVSTIARPVLTAERYELAVFATLSGMMSGALMGAKAIAPLAAAVIHQITGGYLAVMLLCGLGCLVGAGCLALVGRTGQRDGHRRREENRRTFAR